MIHKVISRDAFNNKWNKEDMIRAYLDFGANVKETCPKDQLLVFSVTQGWEPLCAFLNVPVPSVPFPRLNSTADYAQMQIKIATVGAAACVIGLGIPALLAQQSLLDPSEIRHHEKMKAAVYTKFASKKEEEGAGKAGDFANITVKKLSKPIAKPGFAGYSFDSNNFATHLMYVVVLSRQGYGGSDQPLGRQGCQGIHPQDGLEHALPLRSGL